MRRRERLRHRYAPKRSRGPKSPRTVGGSNGNRETKASAFSRIETLETDCEVGVVACGDGSGVWVVGLRPSSRGAGVGEKDGVEVANSRDGF